MLVLFPPAGIVLLWFFNKKSNKTKGILSAISAVWFVIILCTSNSPNSNDDTAAVLAENKSVIENDIAENNITESITVENIEITFLPETPDTESIEFSTPESTEDIQAEQESIPTPEHKPESAPTSESGAEIHTGNSSSSTVPNTETDNNDKPAPGQPNDAPAAPDTGDGNNNFDTYDNTEQQQTADTYVLNNSNKKIHYPSCSSVPKIAPNNYATSSQTVEELIAQGYSTCGVCFK